MKRRFTFEDAQKGIKGTPVPVDLDDHGTRFWLNELGFSDSLTKKAIERDTRTGDLFQSMESAQ